MDSALNGSYPESSLIWWLPGKHFSTFAPFKIIAAMPTLTQLQHHFWQFYLHDCAHKFTTWFWILWEVKALSHTEERSCQKVDRLKKRSWYVCLRCNLDTSLSFPEGCSPCSRLPELCREQLLPGSCISVKYHLCRVSCKPQERSLKPEGMVLIARDGYWVKTRVKCKDRYCSWTIGRLKRR